MEKINIAAPDFSYDEEDPDGFRAGMLRAGKQLGAADSGVTVYELAPGQAVCPYHYEVGEEEWLLVLSGHPSLRTPEGTERLDPWDLVVFPKGPEGAHGIGNETDADARVLMFSTVVTPTATVYPDSDKIGIWTGNEESDGMFRRGGAVDYYEGEPGT